MITIIALVDPYPGTQTGSGTGEAYSDGTFHSDSTGFVV